MTGNTNISQAPDKPLSPHLQIYKPQITSVMSIMHRATGVALTFALFVLAWWLLAAAAGPDAYQFFRDFVSHPIGIMAAIGLSFALFYHTCTGIRHLFLDSGRFFSIPEIYLSGYTALACAFALTTLFWLAIIF